MENFILFYSLGLFSSLNDKKEKRKEEKYCGGGGFFAKLSLLQM